MKEALRWLPGILSGLLWVSLPALIQPWLSRFGIFLYVDPLLLFLPALLFPPRPAIVTVLLCTVWADAARPAPFGLSASLLLPALLILQLFQEKFLRWPRTTWFSFALSLSALLILLYCLLCAAFSPGTIPWTLHLENILCTLLVSLAWIAMLGMWYFSFQLSCFLLVRKNLLEERLKKE